MSRIKSTVERIRCCSRPPAHQHQPDTEHAVDPEESSMSMRRRAVEAYMPSRAIGILILNPNNRVSRITTVPLLSLDVRASAVAPIKNLNSVEATSNHVLALIKAAHPSG